MRLTQTFLVLTLVAAVLLPATLSAGQREILSALEARYAVGAQLPVETLANRSLWLEKRAAVNPEQKSRFELAFDRPLTRASLVDLATRHDLDVARILLLRSLEGSDEVATLALFALEGSGDLDAAIDSRLSQIAFQHRARQAHFGDGGATQLSRQALETMERFDAYGLQATASYADAASLLRDGSVSVLALRDFDLPSPGPLKILEAFADLSRPVLATFPADLDGARTSGAGTLAPPPSPGAGLKATVPPSATCSGPFSCPAPPTWVPASSDFSAIISDINDPLLGTPLSSGDVITSVRWSRRIEAGFEINLAAFQETSLPQCNTTFGVDMPCDGPNQVFVPASAYEDEFEMDDLNCLAPVRSGNSTIDFGLGCLVVTAAFSQLPVPVLDTTFSDAGDEFQPTIIAARGVQLRSGTTYLSQMFYGGFGHRVTGLIGRTAQQNAQINTYVPSGALDPFLSFKVNERDRITSHRWFPLLIP